MLDPYRFLIFGNLYPSHYEEKAEGVKITLSGFTTNEKIVEACKDLSAYPREYVPAKDLTEAQQKSIAEAKLQREMNRYLYDLGLWKSSNIKPSTFTIQEKKCAIDF
jgi:hypothetical protein